MKLLAEIAAALGRCAADHVEMRAVLSKIGESRTCEYGPPQTLNSRAGEDGVRLQGVTA